MTSSTTGESNSFWKELNEDENISSYKNNFLIPRNRLMNLSDHEKKEHENFINEMKNPIWKE